MTDGRGWRESERLAGASIVLRVYYVLLKESSALHQADLTRELKQLEDAKEALASSLKSSMHDLGVLGAALLVLPLRAIVFVSFAL